MLLVLIYIAYIGSGAETYIKKAKLRSFGVR